ncbi:MAG: hypothetical protein JNL51_02855 [Chitinophagaceae bacterium]|nr:hypothetical protein [Chitinophagaceae bacterium]
MKKIIIGAVVAGIIIFICQTLSWTILDLHRSANQYTPKQTEILNFLGNQLEADGQYLLPSPPPGASMEESQAIMKETVGKPWAIIAYHKQKNDNMTSSIIRVLLVNIFMAGLFCWILSKMTKPSFATIFLSSLFTGLIVFMNIPYTTHVFYQTFDLTASLIDAIVGWGLAGLWLGRLFSKQS